MSVLEAVRKDLLRIAKAAPEVAESAEAATAMALAAEIDGNNSATSKSMCARALTEIMAGLRASMPEKEEADDLDELKRRRAARTAGLAAAKAAVPS